jgi:hypothetical protein
MPVLVQHHVNARLFVVHMTGVIGINRLHYIQTQRRQIVSYYSKGLYCDYSVDRNVTMKVFIRLASIHQDKVIFKGKVNPFVVVVALKTTMIDRNTVDESIVISNRSVICPLKSGIPSKINAS